MQVWKGPNAHPQTNNAHHKHIPKDTQTHSTHPKQTPTRARVGEHQLADGVRAQVHLGRDEPARLAHGHEVPIERDGAEAELGAQLEVDEATHAGAVAVAGGVERGGAASAVTAQSPLHWASLGFTHTTLHHIDTAPPVTAEDPKRCL